MMRRFFVCALVALVPMISACSGNAMAPLRYVAGIRSQAASSFARPALPNPALLGVSQATGALVAWRISRNGGTPVVVDADFGVTNGLAMVADGNTIFVAESHQNVIVRYDVVTGKRTTFADPWGEPVDLAIGSDRSIYAVSNGGSAGVVVYPQGRNRPQLLQCSLMDFPRYVAVDSDGNLFVNGSKGSTLLVVEIPRGGSCRDLHLRPESGYVAGIAYDPKTGDLLVMDDPGVCLGPPAERITIYPKPYTKQNAHSFSYNGGTCAIGLRLNATSSLMFFTNPTPHGGSIVFQVGLPGGKPAGRVYTGGNPEAISTIPNALPN